MNIEYGLNYHKTSPNNIIKKPFKQVSSCFSKNINLKEMINYHLKFKLIFHH